MAEQANQSPDTPEIQVFNLTMDNPEDQDELNRRLLKPEASVRGSFRNGRGISGNFEKPSPTESSSEKKGING